MGKVIAIFNQKGGVGKTTTNINLAACLALRGKKVLVLDIDPQGNTTSGLGVAKKGLKDTVYNVLVDVDYDIRDAVIHTGVENLDLIPASVDLAGAEVELVQIEGREEALKKGLYKIKDGYDYIFIDCPPSLGLLTINSLAAVDSVLIPIQCEFYALEGVTKLLDSMKRVKTRLNPSLEISGVLLTMYDNRTTLSKQVVDEVKSYFGRTVFNTLIPRTVKLSEAPSYGMPITEYDPRGKGAISYIELAKEVISRG